MNTKTMSHVEKAAVLLLALGEDISIEIFKKMTESEVRKISQAMSRLGRIEQKVVDQIMQEFHTILSEDKKFVTGGSELTKNIIGKALGHDKANEIASKTGLARIEAVELVEPQTLASLIRNEHPQTIAIILAHGKPKTSSLILKHLPESIRTDLLIRVANLDAVSDEMIEEVDHHLRQEILKLGNRSLKRGGAEFVAEMLGQLGKDSGDKAIDAIEERDAELADKIRDLMFTFEDLSKIDNRGIQELLKHTNANQLMIALKAGSEAVRLTFLNNLSARARKLLEEDMAALPPIRKSDAETAQRAIVQLASKLYEEGKISINSDEPMV